MPDAHEAYLELFPDRKRLARANLLREAAEMAARSVSAKILTEHGDAKAIVSAIGEARAQRFVSEYINKVIFFKQSNGIEADKRVEPPKIAAIMVCHLYSKPIEDLFISSEKYTPGESPYPQIARGTFFNRLIYACLGLPVGFVKEPLGQDLHRILVTEPFDNERLISVLLKGVFIARGDEHSCLED